MIFCKIVKWRRWRHAPRLMATAVITDSRHCFSKRWHVANVKNIAGDDQTTIRSIEILQSRVPSVFTSVYVCVIATVVPRLTGNGSCHAPARSYFEEMTCCRHQKLHWRWPGNPSGRSKFHNLGLFTFKRLQLMLRRQLRWWWRLPENAQTAHSRRQKHRRDDQDRSKFCKNENVCLQDRAKRLEKLVFAAMHRAAFDGIVHCFFSAITRNGFCSHLRKIISRRLWHPPKNWDIHIAEFFARFYW